MVANALRAAYWRKKPKPGLMHHSDRGSQYCGSAYPAAQLSILLSPEANQALQTLAFNRGKSHKPK